MSFFADKLKIRSAIIIHCNCLSRQHGSQILFTNASFQVLAGVRTGLVGPNGAGKSTIFRLITGEEQPDKGEISCGKNTVIGYFSQEAGEMQGRSALAETMSAAACVVRLGEEIREMEAAMAAPMSDEEMAVLLERYGNAVEVFEHRGGYDLESRAQAVLTGLGIGPDAFHRPVESFSGGWKMRIALAKILTMNPDVLLLDEPTNHLDLQSREILLDTLQKFTGTVVLVSHDRHFLRSLVDRVIEIDHGAMRTYEGDYSYYLRKSAEPAAA